MHWPVWRVAVAERSMEPALVPGDWLLVWRGLRRSQPVRIKPGQLVVARHPARPQTLIVKRVAWREPDGWWLNSDNPKAGTADSFRFGAVSPELIEGRVLGRFFPLRRDG